MRYPKHPGIPINTSIPNDIYRKYPIGHILFPGAGCVGDARRSSSDVVIRKRLSSNGTECGFGFKRNLNTLPCFLVSFDGALNVPHPFCLKTSSEMLGQVRDRVLDKFVVYSGEQK